jgi:hypothetical protein
MSYTLTSADVGQKVRVVVTATNGTGTAQAPSSEVGPVVTAATVAQIHAALLRLLTLRGPATTITAVLANNGYTASFDAPSAGRLTVDWRNNGLVAEGAITYTSAGRGRVTITLTRYGRRLLRGSRDLSVTATGTFMPSPDLTVAADETIRLRR